MLIIGSDYLASVAGAVGFSAKMVFNDRGAIFFPVDRQHRDMKAENISYEDDYKGNALAAMLGPGRIEIRFHKAFSDRQVAQIIRELRRRPDVACLAGWQVTYQGRPIGDA